MEHKRMTSKLTSMGMSALLSETIQMNLSHEDQQHDLASNHHQIDGHHQRDSEVGTTNRDEEQGHIDYYNTRDNNISIDSITGWFKNPKGMSVHSKQLNCRVCHCHDFLEYPSSGDLICHNCVAIMQSRFVSDEAEFRVYSDDDSSKSCVRVGASYNPNMPYSLTSKYRIDQDDTEFLWKGLSDIKELVEKLYGPHPNETVHNRAQYLFSQAFRQQVLQKLGLKKMNSQRKKRQKFSRRKQFVITCVCPSFFKGEQSEEVVSPLFEQHASRNRSDQILLSTMYGRIVRDHERQPNGERLITPIDEWRSYQSC